MRNCSKELKEILAKLKKENKTIFISRSKIFCSIIDLYLDKKGSCKSLNARLNKINIEDLRSELTELKELENKAINDSKLTTDEEDLSEENTSFLSTDAAELFKKTDEFIDKNGYNVDEITTDFLVTTLFNESKKSNVANPPVVSKLYKIVNNYFDLDLGMYSKTETKKESTEKQLKEMSLGELLAKAFGKSDSKSNNPFPDFPDAPNMDIRDKDEMNFEKFGGSSPINGTELDLESDTPYLDQFSVDMTKKAKEGLYDPVIGREDIIESMVEILGKRKKANVALLGVAGAGKSSTVERLAQRIVSGKVPSRLKDKRICSLNINDLVAGTKYRGEFEERLQKIIKEVCDSKNTIIYIDELHNLVGSGSGGNGNGDGANILKPYLARGEFQCIGSTTNEEYRKFIEKDAALNRRFTTIEILEPTSEETIKILSGIKSKYEDFHKVIIDSSVIEACVEYSKYVTDKHQPDKSIDILDLCCSLTSLDETNLSQEKQKEDQLNKITESKINAVLKKNDFVEGEKLRQEELVIKKELNKTDKSLWIKVTPDKVATAVSKISRVPVDKIQQTDRDKINRMKNELKKQVIGQDKAIDAVVKKIQYTCLGFKPEGKPIFTGLFVGNTGTGKTLICKEIAKIFFGSQSNLIKIDCGELRGEGSVSKLIGTTAGYVGFENSVPLFDAVRRKPSCVLLLDEIEKCDKSIYEIFMNILDEGYCILGDTTRVDFSNAIIIFTGNVGTQELQQNSGNVGFIENDNIQHKTEKIVNKAIKDRFKPEFLNRLDEVVIFNELGKSEMSKIFNIEIGKIKKQLKNKKITIEISKELKARILEKVDYKMGARDLKRLINDYIIDSLSDTLSKTTANNFKLSLNKDGNVEVEY